MEYTVPKAVLNGLNYPFIARDCNYMPGRDEAYPIPRDWLAANAGQFYVGKNEILAAAVDEFPDLGYEFFCGIYFLILDDQIEYVGASKNISKRISEHAWVRPMKAKVAWIETPEWCVYYVESFYINELRPRRNAKIPTFCSYCKHIAAAKPADTCA